MDPAQPRPGGAGAEAHPVPIAVALQAVEGEWASELQQLVEAHYERTNSPLAARLLDTWSFAVQRFVCVLPNEYARVLEQQRERERGVA